MNSFFRYSGLLLLSCSLVVGRAQGQFIASVDSRNVSSGLLRFSTVQDSLAENLMPWAGAIIAEGDSTQRPSPRLLPQALSPVEQVLWGENGLMRSTGIAPLTPQSRMTELKVRRAMLTVHQLGGYVTLGLLIPTIIQGQRDLQNWNDATNGVRPFSRGLNRTHKLLGELTFASYMTTASFALFSPPPLIRRDDWDTVKLHKTLAWIHFTGMIALPILGSMAYHASSVKEAKTLRTIHQITGYTTAAAFSISMIVLTF